MRDFAERLWPTRQQWRRWSLPSKLALFAAVIGVLPLLAWPIGCAIKAVKAWRANPRPDVSVQKTESEITIRLRMHSPTSSTAIDFPVLGRIKNIHDYNSPTDAVVASTVIEGSNLPDSQNNVQIRLTDIKPELEISFKILYEPTAHNLIVEGTDRWHLSYSWLYNGATETRSKWIRIHDGKEVDAPPFDIRGTLVVPRALSPEEIKKLYEQGPVRNQPRAPSHADPEYSKYEEGRPDLSGVQQALLDQFAKPEGAIDFVAQEKNNGVSNDIRFANEGRQFIFDPVSMEASFSTRTKSGKLIILVQPFFPTASGRHRIIITWGPDGGRLLVDGKVQSDRD